MTSKPQNLWRKLTAPRATDEHEARREYFVNVILVGAGAIDFAYTLVIALAYCITGVPLPTLLAGVLTLPLSPLGLWLSRRGWWRVAALAPLLGLLSVTIYGQYYFGEHDVTIVVYGAIVIIAGIVYGGRAAAGATMISVLSYGIVGWLQSCKLLPSPVDVGLLPQITAIGASLGIIVVLQWLFTSQLQKALRESYTYAQELSKHREHLEELVKERTAALSVANAQLEQKISEREKAEAERERLLVAERAQSRRQAALLRLSAELAATLDEAEMGQRVVDGLHDTLGYDFVALCLEGLTTSLNPFMLKKFWPESKRTWPCGNCKSDFRTPIRGLRRN